MSQQGSEEQCPGKREAKQQVESIARISVGGWITDCKVKECTLEGAKGGLIGSQMLRHQKYCEAVQQQDVHFYHKDNKAKTKSPIRSQGRFFMLL